MSGRLKFEAIPPNIASKPIRCSRVFYRPV